MRPVFDAVCPMADETLTQEILDLLQQCTQNQQVKKGANEATKSVKHGLSELIVLAGNTDPLAILLHIPALCESKNVPYIFVPSRLALGRACGVKRGVIAVSINSSEASELAAQIRSLKDKKERLAI
ncbi:50S ribosomal protein L30e-like protein [Aspergillus avenaceus]|uniref:H/ACA ribonucleoprotein complex subunit 2 n=1 Tax=Aspergillus avenaceus TaxID=36643 RepID=A0A5N6TKY8_ASPAV|nr:50S ribosomal protein L30e-like protein [Aspergillus avenaceus]